MQRLISMADFQNLYCYTALSVSFSLLQPGVKQGPTLGWGRILRALLVLRVGTISQIAANNPLLASLR